MPLKAMLLDLDGTVYLGTREVPGAAAFVARMAQRGVRSLFVTNRSNRTPAEIGEHLAGYGIACEARDVLTSSQATAALLEPGTSVYMIGETGLELALRERGLRFDDEAAEAVVVSFDRGFTYEKLKKACRLIERGARYLATNPDRALKLENGISPGTGAIVAAVTAGCGVEPLMVGKPERLIFDMALQRLGVDPDNAVAVGDNLATDIPAGRKAGIRTALILTGVTTREQAQAARPAPDWIVADYAELEACLAAL